MLRSSHLALNSRSISFSVKIGSWLPIIAAVSIFTLWAVLCFRLNLSGIVSSGASITVLGCSIDFLLRDAFKVWKLAFWLTTIGGEAIDSIICLLFWVSAAENFIDLGFFTPTMAERGLAFVGFKSIGATSLAILAWVAIDSFEFYKSVFCKSPFMLYYLEWACVSIMTDPKPISISGVVVLW